MFKAKDVDWRQGDVTKCSSVPPIPFNHLSSQFEDVKRPSTPRPRGIGRGACLQSSKPLEISPHGVTSTAVSAKASGLAVNTRKWSSRSQPSVEIPCRPISDLTRNIQVGSFMEPTVDKAWYLNCDCGDGIESLGPSHCDGLKGPLSRERAKQTETAGSLSSSKLASAAGLTGASPFCGAKLVLSEPKLAYPASIADVPTSVDARQVFPKLEQARNVAFLDDVIEMSCELECGHDRASETALASLTNSSQYDELNASDDFFKFQSLLISDYLDPLASLDFEFDMSPPPQFLTSEVNSPVSLSSLPQVRYQSIHQALAVEKNQNQTSSFEPSLANVLRHTFEVLSLRPGMFSAIMPALTKVLRVNVNVEKDVDEVINEVCLMSILDENVRYNGARVCTRLVKDFESLKFLERLLKRCRDEYDLGYLSRWFETGRSSCGKVALFVGELMVQLNAELGKPSEILIHFVLRFFELMLDMHEDAALVKCLVQLFKLTGVRLHSVATERFETIMRRVKDVILRESVSGKSRLMLLSIVAMSHIWKDNEAPEKDDVDKPQQSCLELAAAAGDLAPSKIALQAPEKRLDNSVDDSLELEWWMEDFGMLVEEEEMNAFEEECYEEFLRKTGQQLE